LLDLVAVWISGRIAVTFSAATTWWFAMLVDGSFLLLVAAAAMREIAAGRNWRNLPVVALVLLLLAGNLTFHLEANLFGSADYGIRIGMTVIVLLISLIGGRIIPSFTRNWLVRENPGRLPVPFAQVDKIAVIASALALVCWIIAPDHPVAGVLLGLAGMLQLVRLSRWAGERTLRERLLLILHIGYLFVPLGFLLNAASAFDLLPASAGIHAWIAGAAGIMTLAMMTRATIGHTGGELTASRTTQAIYLAIIVAAVTRICAVLEPQHSEILLHVAGFTWAAAFLGFAVAFGPLLLGSKARPADPSAPA